MHPREADLVITLYMVMIRRIGLFFLWRGGFFGLLPVNIKRLYNGTYNYPEVLYLGL